MADAPAPAAPVVARKRYARSGVGAVELTPQPATPSEVQTYRESVVAANVLLTHSEKSSKAYGIGGAILFSVGASVGLSAEGKGWQQFGAALAGLGAGGLGAALHHYLVARDARIVRDNYAKGLLDAGQPLPDGSGVAYSSGAIASAAVPS